ncbi:Phage-related lysozyme (muraminidase) [Salmonella enterica subsp. arizonae]|uniref:Phage-related lysozyme (Muraminidase) n=4 Tax=Salmonella enterica TaxID=28901 RepID=A0A2X4WAZ9_SALER|nr:Phage-related lysozyme (muraminidase) [Salmonella enterica subsp. arizonae]
MLNQDTPEKSVPLQFMMDGEVVAWRVNRDYAAIECYQERPLRQSGTFVLVKSVYKPDEQDESSWLTLYQLYMHIAPLSEFPKRPLYRVTQKGHGVRMRKHSRHDDSREIVPDVLANKHGHARTLMQGETLTVLQQKSFLLELRPEPFTLVQRLQDGKPAGDLFWVSMRPEYLEPDGECYVCLPEWMHHALNHGVFDDVVVPSAPLKVTVKAGDPVGFLGAQDLADEDNYPQIITTDYKAHIELLSLDEHVPDVVANVKGIKTGKQFIKLKLKRPLYLRNGEDEESTFEQMSAITRADAGKIIPRDATYPFTDKNGVTYFQIRPHTWMHQDDVEQLSQHDLAGLDFDCIEAEHTTDFTRTLDERWVIDALKSISSHFDSEKGPASAQAKMFYDSLIHNAENRRPPDPYPDKSQDELLFGALHTDQMNIPEYARRLIVKHDSDWHSTREDTRWSSVFTVRDESPVVKMANGGFLDVTRWMDKVPPFASQRSVWHFHPLEFLYVMSGNDDMDIKWLTVPKGQLTFDAEGNDNNDSPYFSRHIHWPGGVSGITIGRGYDLGQQNDPSSDFDFIELSQPLNNWLVESKGMSGLDAKNRYKSADSSISDYEITRKQQYDLFVITYNRLEADVKSICQKPNTIRVYHPNPNTTPEQAWNDIPEKIKEVLVDLRYRGDYTPHARSLIQRHAYSGDLSSFGQVLSNRTQWSNVPQDRFLRRVRFYEN